MGAARSEEETTGRLPAVDGPPAAGWVRGAESQPGADSRPGAGGAPPRNERDLGRWTSLVVFIGYAVLALAFTAVRVHEIGKPIDYDVGNYEYYSGFGLLHGWRSAIALPGQLETYLDAQLNTVYYFLITHLTARLFVYSVAALQAIPVLLLAFFVFLVGRRSTGAVVWPLLAGLVAGCAAFLAPLHIVEMGETSSDVLLATFVYLGAALLYRIVRTTEWRRSWYWHAAGAGVLLGLAGELKFTQAAFSAAVAIAFPAALLVARRTTRWSYGRLALLTVAVVVPALAVAAALYVPEAIVLWQRYHDPFFPLMNGYFHSSYLLPGSFNPGYAANSLPSLWHHFTGLVIDGERRHNTSGIYLERLRSPLLFFSLIVVAVAFVVDLVRRTHADAVFVEISFLLGFLLWAVLFGFYRYLAPLEMASLAVIVLIVFMHDLYRPLVVVALAAFVALAVPLSIYATVGAREAFGTSYFGVRAGEFANLKGDGVVFAGKGSLAFLVPDLPADTELVRTGGNLGQVMSDAWWVHVRSVLAHNPRAHWVLFYGSPTIYLSQALHQIGFGGFHSCLVVHTAENRILVVHECQLDPPARS